MRHRTARLGLESLESRRLLAAVDIPEDLSGSPAAIVSAPVRIDSANGVRGAEIRLRYDTSILDLDSNSVVAGSIWTGIADAQVVANVDDAAGTAIIFVSAATALPDVSGSLVQLNFTIDGNAAIGETAAIDLTQVILDEGGIPVSPAPIPGADSTDGMVVVSGGTDPVEGDDRIAGFVFADANLDGTLSLGEAIPGVKITLTNTTSGARQQTRTGSDGSYEFINLAPGNYQLQQQQPVAYIDGGVNQLTVQLVEGVASVNQNFVEVGLRPQFLYTRLLTTTLQPVASPLWQAQIEQINIDAESGIIAPPGQRLLTAAATNSEPSTNSLRSAATSTQSVFDSTTSPAEGEAAVDPRSLLVGYTAIAPTGLDLDTALDLDEVERAQRHAALDQALLDLIAHPR